MATILIADSGGTKTDWTLLSSSNPVCFKSAGINPFQLTDEAIREILLTQVCPHIDERVAIAEVFFYGAGCRDTGKERMQQALAEAFSGATIFVETDLLGAARAVCGNTEGIVAILGTGANSGHYDGEQLVSNISPLGYILGDEGSGAVLGRRLLGDIFKQQLPAELIADFEKTYSLSINTLLQKVYREPKANAFLASFTTFLSKHRKHAAIQQLLKEEFVRFFQRNILPYQQPSLSVSLIGGIAATFAEELLQVAHSLDLQIGNILPAPIQGLINYHQR